MHTSVPLTHHILVPIREASPLRYFWAFFRFCLLLLLLRLRLRHTQMTPKGDADFCRDQARRDLLALLEGVSNSLLFPTGLF